MVECIEAASAPSPWPMAAKPEVALREPGTQRCPAFTVASITGSLGRFCLQRHQGRKPRTGRCCPSNPCADAKELIPVVATEAAFSGQAGAVVSNLCPDAKEFIPWVAAEASRVRRRLPGDMAFEPRSHSQLSGRVRNGAMSEQQAARTSFVHNMHPCMVNGGRSKGRQVEEADRACVAHHHACGSHPGGAIGSGEPRKFVTADIIKGVE